jgi:hypothetical protein
MTHESPFEGVSLIFEGEFDPEQFYPGELARREVVSVDEAITAEIRELTPAAADYSLTWAIVEADPDSLAFRPRQGLASHDILRDLALTALRSAGDTRVESVALSAFRHTDIDPERLRSLVAVQESWFEASANVQLESIDLTIEKGDGDSWFLAAEPSNLLEGGVFLAVGNWLLVEADDTVAAACKDVEAYWTEFQQEALGLLDRIGRTLRPEDP